MLFIAAYKASGKLTDKAVRSALSVRHGKKIPYSHVELLKNAPSGIYNRHGSKFQDSIAASKRDNYRVRLVKNMEFKPGNWDFFSLPMNSDLQVWEQALVMLDRPYDTIGAALCITPFARLHLDKEWCSGMIADLADWTNPELYDPYMVTRKALSLGGFKVVG